MEMRSTLLQQIWDKSLKSNPWHLNNQVKGTIWQILNYYMICLPQILETQLTNMELKTPCLKGRGLVVLVQPRRAICLPNLTLHKTLTDLALLRGPQLCNPRMTHILKTREWKKGL